MVIDYATTTTGKGVADPVVLLFKIDEDVFTEARARATLKAIGRSKHKGLSIARYNEPAVAKHLRWITERALVGEEVTLPTGVSLTTEVCDWWKTHEWNFDVLVGKWPMGDDGDIQFLTHAHWNCPSVIHLKRGDAVYVSGLGNGVILNPSVGKLIASPRPIGTGYSPSHCVVRLDTEIMTVPRERCEFLSGERTQRASGRPIQEEDILTILRRYPDGIPANQVAHLLKRRSASVLAAMKKSKHIVRSGTTSNCRWKVLLDKPPDVC